MFPPKRVFTNYKEISGYSALVIYQATHPGREAVHITALLSNKHPPPKKVRNGTEKKINKQENLIWAFVGSLSYRDVDFTIQLSCDQEMGDFSFLVICHLLKEIIQVFSDLKHG